MNNAEDGDDGIINEGTEGVSKKKFLMSEADNDESFNRDKKYTSQIPGSEEGEQDEDKRDEVTKKRENFLNIYKENQDGDANGNDEPDLSNGIRYKTDARDEDPEFELKTGNEGSGNRKPMIQELDAKEAE